jgi:hypothetical protein
MRALRDERPLVLAVPAEAFHWFRSTADVAELHQQLAEYYALLCVLDPENSRHLYRQIEQSYLPLVEEYRRRLGDDPDQAISRYAGDRKRPDFLSPNEFGGIRKHPFGAEQAYEFGIVRWGAGPEGFVREDRTVLEVRERARLMNRKWIVPTKVKHGPRRQRVYFVFSNKLTKIGFTTKDLKSRVAGLQVGSPTMHRLLGWFDGGKPLEDALHEEFKDLHVRGEWYRMSEKKALAILNSRGGTTGP